MTEKKKKAFYFRSWLIGGLRRLSYKYPHRYRALYDSRHNGKFKCAMCDKYYIKTDIHIDHKDPVVGISGFPLNPDGSDDWTTYISRMFPPEGGFQILCKECHKGKSTIENEARRNYKKSVKNEGS